MATCWTLRPGSKNHGYSCSVWDMAFHLLFVADIFLIAILVLNPEEAPWGHLQQRDAHHFACGRTKCWSAPLSSILQCLRTTQRIDITTFVWYSIELFDYVPPDIGRVIDFTHGSLQYRMLSTKYSTLAG